MQSMRRSSSPPVLVVSEQEFFRSNRANGCYFRPMPETGLTHVPKQALELIELLIDFRSEFASRFVFKWMDLPRAVRQEYSYCVAIRCRDSSDPQHYHCTFKRGMADSLRHLTLRKLRNDRNHYASNSSVSLGCCALHILAHMCYSSDGVRAVGPNVDW
jgi:hypothetical protein